MTNQYLPQTEGDIEEMLAAIGMASIDDLFAAIPGGIQTAQITLPPPLSEPELIRDVNTYAAKNKPLVSFIGGGSYNHFIPCVVDQMCLRSEFYTAYTPYQAEVSQGTLQVIYEYQSMLCALTGMDVANASLYDGASAVAEAALLSHRQTHKEKLLVARYLHPHYRQVLETYLRGVGMEILEIPASGGVTQVGELKGLLDENTAAVVLPQPNFLGLLEPMDVLAKVAEESGAMLISVVNPITLGVLAAPCEYGAELVVGEGQPLGIPKSFGGPGLGFMAAQDKHKRAMPGRIAGRTTDAKGQSGFVLTLQTREQHIRREKATSNICTNEGLCMLAAAVYMSLLGPEGFHAVGVLNLDRSHKAYGRLLGIPGISSAFEQPFFNEFPLRIESKDVGSLIAHAAGEGLGLGIDLGQYYEELKGCIAMCFTEMTTEEDVDRLVRFLD